MCRLSTAWEAHMKRTSVTHSLMARQSVCTRDNSLLHSSYPSFTKLKWIRWAFCMNCALNIVLAANMHQIIVLHSEIVQIRYHILGWNHFHSRYKKSHRLFDRLVLGSHLNRKSQTINHCKRIFTPFHNRFNAQVAFDWWQCLYLCYFSFSL